MEEENKIKTESKRKSPLYIYIGTFIAFSLSIVAVIISIINRGVGPSGPQGETGSTGLNGSDGSDGVSVVSIVKTSTEGLVDTYTITYSDGSTSTFTVTNGQDGAQGIQGGAGKDGHTPIISIGANGNWFVDGVDTNISAKGEKGDQGEKGDTAWSNTILPSSHGYINASKGSALLNEDISFTFMPDSGYTLSSYTLNGTSYTPVSYEEGDIYSTSGLKQIENGYVVGATFIAITPSAVLTLEDIVVDGNTVCTYTSTVSNGSKIKEGDTISITLNPVTDYLVTGISLNDDIYLVIDDGFTLSDGLYTYTFDVTESMISAGEITVKALAYVDPSTVSYSVSLVEEKDASGNAIYAISADKTEMNLGDTLNIKVTPSSDDYVLYGLLINGVKLTVTDGDITLNDDGSFDYAFVLSNKYLSSSKNIVISAEAKDATYYDVKIYSKDESQGTIALSATKAKDLELISVTVTPLEGYKFDDVLDSAGNSYKSGIIITDTGFDIHYSPDLSNIPFYVTFKKDEEYETKKLISQGTDKIIETLDADMDSMKLQIDALENISVTTIFNLYKEEKSIDLFEVFTTDYVENEVTYYLTFNLTSRTVGKGNASSTGFYADTYRVIDMEDAVDGTQCISQNSSGGISYNLFTFNMEGFGIVLDDDFNLDETDDITTYNSFELGNVDSAVKKGLKLKFNNALNASDSKNLSDTIRIDTWFLDGNDVSASGWEFSNTTHTANQTGFDKFIVDIELANKPTAKIKDLSIEGVFSLNKGYYNSVKVLDDTPYIKVSGASVDNLSMTSSKGLESVSSVYFIFESGTIGNLSIVSMTTTVGVDTVIGDNASLNAINLDDALNNNLTTAISFVCVSNADNESVANKVESLLGSYDTKTAKNGTMVTIEAKLKA